MIKLQNITAGYGQGKQQTNALKNVTLEIPADTMCAIMGKSGSGKTTLLKVIGSLLPPFSGEMYFENINVYNTNDAQRSLLRRRQMGFIYQAYDLLPELTVYENIVLPLLLDKKKPVKKDVLSLSEAMGIRNLLGKLPQDISGGEQQRTAIARAVIHKPNLLLCDEPTGNLDETTANMIIDTIRNLQKELHTTVVLVTHDRDIAAKTDYILHIRDGKLEG